MEPPSPGLLQAASLVGFLPNLFTETALLLPLGAALLGVAASSAALARSLPGDGEPAPVALPPWLARAPTRRMLSLRLLHLVALVGASLGFGLAAIRWTWLPLPLGLRLVLLAVLLALGYLALREWTAYRLASQLRPPRVLEPLLRLWLLVTGPLVVPLERLASASPQRRPDPRRLLQRLDAALDATPSEDPQLLLVRNALAFGDRTASDLMVPRPDVVWVDVDDDPAVVLARIRGSGHSRLPLCVGGPDKVVGYLHARDLALARSAGGAELRALARPVSFVPETAPAPGLLKRFQEARSHLAVVVDEFGGMSGLLTLEDVLEELVGEIRDEFDHDDTALLALDDGQLLVDGGVRIDVLCERYPLGFGEAEEETVGGFIFGQLAREVATGDEVEIAGAVLRVERVEGLRVTRVRVIPTGSRVEVGSTG